MTAIVRFVIFFDVETLLSDGTFISADLITWSLVEPGMYLIAACLPTLRPLFRELRSRSGGWNSVSKGSGSTGGIPLAWRERRDHTQISDGDTTTDV